MSDLDYLLRQVQSRLDLDRETEQDVLAEIRVHLEDAMERGMAAGLSREVSLSRAAERFGVGQEVGQALQAVHAGWGTAEAVAAAGLPVLLALVLRWLLFAPDGTTIGWQQVLSRPAFWIVALVALLVPLLKLRRWRYALATWGFFWFMTVLFTLLPALRW